MTFFLLTLTHVCYFSVKSIKMNFCKLDNATLGPILHDLAQLQHLCYISLAGNRLDKMTLEKLQLVHYDHEMPLEKVVNMLLPLLCD